MALTNGKILDCEKNLAIFEKKVSEFLLEKNHFFLV